MAGSLTGGVGFSQLMYNPPYNSAPDQIVGTAPPAVWTRSVLDARRMMNRRTPEASYPDGYLGTITSRRGDRLLDSLKARENQRSYQRGVHMGERIDPGNYLDPPGMDPLRGLKRQATTGERFAPELNYWQPHLAVDGKALPRGSESIVTINNRRAAQLGMLRPTYGLPVPKRVPS